MKDSFFAFIATWKDSYGAFNCKMSQVQGEITIDYIYDLCKDNSDTVRVDFYTDKEKYGIDCANVTEHYYADQYDQWLKENSMVKIDGQVRRIEPQVNEDY